ncbi:MAG: hypothetical protein ACR2HG_10015 [Pyrinomonadaceae bacterium]
MNTNASATWTQKQKEREKTLRQMKKGKAKDYAGFFSKRIYGAILIVAIALPLVALGAYFYQQHAVNSELEVSGNIITVKAGGDFQAALNRAKAGDTIVLQAGAKYVGAFVLPNKTGNEFITIQSSELAKLPEDGKRVSPQDAALMPKIMSSGKGESAVKTAPSAHHYRFVGIEFAPDSKDYIYNLVALGSDKQTAREMPHDIEIDRCYLHPNPNGKTRRGIALNDADTVIKNSYLAGFAYKEEETQAIAGWNGSGGYKIINNYIEAGAENILFGGADPSIVNLVPTDIEIRNNLMTKPLEWRGRVTIKCTFELKNAKNVRIIGNIIENSFDENVIRITVRNQDGAAPWSVIEDVTMQNNLIRNGGGGILFLGADDGNKSATMKRVKIINNLFTKIEKTSAGADGRFITIADGEDVQLENNTVLSEGNIITAHRAPSRRFIFRNNIVSFNEYGFNGGNGEAMKQIFSTYFLDGTITNNLIVNGKHIPKSDIYIPPRNFFADDFKDVGFVNLQDGNYRLAPNSKFKNKGANGKDLGADIDQIEAEIRKAQKNL